MSARQTRVKLLRSLLPRVEASADLGLGVGPTPTCTYVCLV